jgi:hypothetical protein
MRKKRMPSGCARFTACHWLIIGVRIMSRLAGPAWRAADHPWSIPSRAAAHHAKAPRHSPPDAPKP